MKLITAKMWAEYKRAERVQNKRISKLELNQQYGKLASNSVSGKGFTNPLLGYRVSNFFEVVSVYRGDAEPVYSGLNIDDAIVVCANANIKAGKGFRYEIRRMK